MANSVRELRLDAVYPWTLIWEVDEGGETCLDREYHRTREAAEEALLGCEPWENAEIVPTAQLLSTPMEDDCPF